MEHFAPHHNAKFEGWYSKFDLENGAHIALIICSVPNASSRPHMVSFTYYPSSGEPIFQQECFIDNIERITTDKSTKAFELRVPGMGYMRAASNGTTTYALESPDKSWTLHAQSTSHTPWSPRKSTPEGWLIHLPLPLHWHVHSLSSPCTLRLTIPTLGAALPSPSHTHHATIHQEKNWATSFPAAHIWLQAWDPVSHRGICLAGGQILKQTAYMLGFRSPSLNLDFAPPFALCYFNLLAPFMTTRIDWATRSFDISVSSFWHRIEVRAQAPPHFGWFGLASPFAEGHRANFCRESFCATVEVGVFERGGWLPWPWGAWRKVCTERFENASLEFAGGYYPERGVKEE